MQQLKLKLIKELQLYQFENAKLEQINKVTEEQHRLKTCDKIQGGRCNLPDKLNKPINPDPRAEAWATENSWFGTDRAMTYTAFEIHKDLTEKEGYDPKF